MRTATILIALILLVVNGVPTAKAQDNHDQAYKGIWVSTPFPSFNASAGETITLDLKVHNAGLPPQKVALGINDMPENWSAVFLGEGKRVQSVFVAPDSDASVKLRLEPNDEGAKGSHRFEVVANGAGSRFTLPIDITVGSSLPPKLTLKASLPSLRGSPTSDFDYKVTVRNDGGQDATVRFDVAALANAQVKITEEYGSQEVTSLPLKVGEEKTIDAKITPPYNAKQGTYPVTVRATTGKTTAQIPLSMQITGQPELKITGLGERLSADAEAGSETPVQMVLSNTGTAPARDIKLDSTPPSGWKVAFQPARLDALAPNATRTVTASIKPSDKAIAGDYMVTVRADSGGSNQSSDFRVTVRTSTMWGIVGVLVIAAALVVMVFAMMRYGRR